MHECTIIQSSAEKNSALAGEIYANHQPWLLNWLRQKTGCSYNAEDLSHDTFIRMLSADVLALREPRAYLLVIANRLLINRYRRSALERDALEQVAMLCANCDEKSPLDVLSARQLLRLVIEVLMHELPERHRSAFVMARVDGLCYREIAAKLTVSESSVKQYLSKALQQLHLRVFALLDDSA